MKKTLLDASSAILLFKAGLLQELINVYHVFVTRSVLQELTRENHHGADTFLRYISLQKIRVIDEEDILSQSGISKAPMRSLDQGELDTIMCFASGNYDFIITDDGKAARYCKEYSLPFINALLFPRLLSFAGLMSHQASHDKMKAITGFGRYSKEVIELARSCRKESLHFAIPDTAA
ncbi:hypothetical protein ACFLZ5_09370 [Thermodesulfobacteriota bacterium]